MIHILVQQSHIFLYLRVVFPAVLSRYLSEKECQDVILLPLYKGSRQCIFSLYRCLCDGLYLHFSDILAKSISYIHDYTFN